MDGEEKNMDIVQYFKENPLEESLVIYFALLPDMNDAVLVCDYAHDVVKAIFNGTYGLRRENILYHRDMRKLYFTRVHQYSVRKGTRRESHFLSEDRYTLKASPLTVVIHALTLNATGPHDFNLQIDFGDVGTCVFGFNELHIERRLLLSIGKDEQSGDWNYIDAVTRKPVDFYDPFATIAS